MLGMLELLLHWLGSLVKSRGQLEAENLPSSSSGEHSSPTCVAAPAAVQCGSTSIRLALSPLPERAGRRRDHQTRNRDSVASAGFQSFLALEFAIPRRPSGDPERDPGPDPGDEPGQLAVGRASDPLATR